MLHQTIPNKKIILQGAQTSISALEKLYRLNHYRHLPIGNHRSVTLEIKGHLNVEFLQTALQHCMERHEALHSRFAEDREGTYLEVLPAANFLDLQNFPLRIIDATLTDVSTKEKNVYDILRLVKKENFIDEPFKLNKGPLWRAALIKINEKHHHFTMIFHHIIFDEASLIPIFADISAVYNQLLSSVAKPMLPPIKNLSEMDFSQLQEVKNKRIIEWKKQLGHLQMATLIPTDFPPQQSFDFIGKRLYFEKFISQDLLLQLHQNPLLKDMSLNVILLTSVYVILHLYTGRTDLCIGITSANRINANIGTDMNKLVNCFINSLPLAPLFHQNQRFIDWLSAVKQAQSVALKNQLPADTIYQKALSQEFRDSLSLASPYEVLVVVNKPKTTLMLNDTVATLPKELDLNRCKLPLGLNFDEIREDEHSWANLFVEFGTSLFKESTIRLFIERLLQLIQHVANQPSCTLNEIPFILPKDLELIANFNTNEYKNSVDMLVPDFFHKQAEQNPHRIATCFHHKSGLKETISYGELDSNSNALAKYLIRNGLQRGMAVGISLPRSINLFVAILAVLKAGGIVVTTETEYCETLKHKLSSMLINFVIVNSLTESLFTAPICKKINLESATLKAILAIPDFDYLQMQINPEDAAYIMCTSGTSADQPAPKGVLCSHLAFANLCYSIRMRNLPPTTRILSLTLPIFDPIFYDFLIATASAGEMHMSYDEGRYLPHVIEKIIRENKITYLVLLPDLMSKLDPKLPLKNLTCIGQIPNQIDFEKFKRAHPNLELNNGYGITEVGICSSEQSYQLGMDTALIGTSITNTKMVVLHPENYSLCPIGVPGEIYIAGSGLAIGYVGNIELTNQKFPWMVFDAQKNRFVIANKETPHAVRFYATGDYGSWQFVDNKLQQIAIKLLGRHDGLVKINGVQIQPNNAQTVLRNCPLVSEVVVYPNQNKTKLIAYIVPQADSSQATIREQLLAFLTTTLLPRIAYPALNFVPYLPTTSNGKTDKRELERMVENIRLYPKLSEFIHSDLTDTHKKLIAIWADELETSADKIDIHKSFYLLGGNSLLLVRQIDKIKQAFGLDSFTGVDILSPAMTIASVANSLSKATFFNDPYLPAGTFTDNFSTLFPPRRIKPSGQIISKNELPAP